MINKPNFGVIVGRFQVHELHEGHMELFRVVRGLHQRVLVFVGVNPAGASTHNPLDFETRRRMIQAKFPEFTVAPLMDCSTDEYWSEQLDKEIEKFVQYGEVTLYGGRDSFIPHYKGKYMPYHLAQVPERKTTGTSLRQFLTNNVGESADFRAGVIYAINNLYPRVITTVDAAILRRQFSVDIPADLNHTLHLLLARKEGEKYWRLVGGHANPARIRESSEKSTDITFENDAQREVYEETGLSVGPKDVKYICSKYIPDWRWRNTVDGVKTLFFACWTTDPIAQPKANDDIKEVKWVNFCDPQAVSKQIDPIHRDLYKDLVDYLLEQRELDLHAF